MVSKPAGKRPRHIHPEDWCAEKHHSKAELLGLTNEKIESYSHNYIKLAPDSDRDSLLQLRDELEGETHMDPGT